MNIIRSTGKLKISSFRTVSSDIIDYGTVEEATAIIADLGPATHVPLRPRPIKKLLHSDLFL